MRNLQEYGLWLVLVTINAVIVSQWLNILILMSGEVAGVVAGLFLSIFLGSCMFLVIRSLMFCLDRQRYERRLQTSRVLKEVGIA